MSLRWLAVAFVLFAGGWGLGLTGLPLLDGVSSALVFVWCFGAFAGSYVICRCSAAIRIGEATAGAMLMTAVIAAIHVLFPHAEIFAPPLRESWAEIAVAVFAVGSAGAALGTWRRRRDRRAATAVELSLLGALALVGAIVIISIAYALVIAVVPSFGVAFIFMFALLGAPAGAGVVAVVALGERGRTAIIGGAIGLALWSWVLVLIAEVFHPPVAIGPIVVSCMAFALTALLVGLLGVAGVELAERKGWGPARHARLPRAAVR